MYVEIAKIYSKNKSSTCEIMKKEKGIHDCFSVEPQIAKLTVTVCGKCLVKMEQTLNLLYWLMMKLQDLQKFLLRL